MGMGAVVGGIAGGLLGGGSGGGSSSTTESAPWGPAQDILKKLLSDASKLYDEQGGINAEWVNKEIADLSPEMQGVINNILNSNQMKDIVDSMQGDIKTGVSGIGQATGILGDLASGKGGITSEQLNQMAADLYDSDLVKSQKESLQKTVQEGVDKNVQGINQRAGSSGGMGSSRAGVAEGVAIGEGQEAMAQGSAAIENAARQSAMTQALGTLQGNQSSQLGAAGQLGQLGLGAGNLGLGSSSQYGSILQSQLGAAGLLQGHQQNILDNKWFNSQGQQQAGWNNLNNLLGIAGSIGGMGGTSTSSGGSSGGMQGILGGISTGAGLGGMLGNAASNAGGWGALAGSIFSDATMKKKVKRKEGKKTKGGNAVYEWEWNDSAKKVAGKKGKEEGVLAQQAAKKTPEAVSKDKKTGRLMVDYDKA